MVFCTECLDGWWSWEPLRRSCVRCEWCRATHGTICTLNLKTIISSKKLVSVYQYTRRHVPQDRQLHQCRCENLKSPDTLKSDRIKFLLSDPVYGNLLCFISVRDRAQRRRPVVETWWSSGTCPPTQDKPLQSTEKQTHSTDLQKQIISFNQQFWPYYVLLTSD